MRSPLRIALAGMAVLALGLGVGRFVFTPLLPKMQADAGLSLIGAGWLASVNNIGYLLGALTCVALALPQRMALRAGMLLIALATACMGATTALPLWLLLRFVAGVATGVTVVHGIAWCTGQLRARGGAGLEPLLFSGVGIGVVVPGVLIAAVRTPMLDSARWWLIFGVLAAFVVAGIWRVLDAQDHGAATTVVAVGTGARCAAWPLMAMYGLMGFAYIIPAIFLPVIADSQLHMPALDAWFWPIYGSAAALVVLAQGLFPAPRNNYMGLAGCCLLELAGVLLCLHWQRPGGFLLGAALLGAPVMSIVMFTMREANRVDRGNPTRLIGLLTTVFSVGQIVGPMLAAKLAVQHGSFSAPLELAALAAAIAAAVAIVRARQLSMVAMASRTTRHSGCG